MRTVLVLAVSAMILLPLAAALAADDLLQQPGLVKGEFIFTEAAFPQCHASTIAPAADGTLVAAWFGGTRERNPDVGIWTARLVEGKWTKPVEAANGVESAEKRFPCWNPVLFQPKKGP